MASNALSPARNKVPRPAICASKQKLWPYTSSPWIIPTALDLSLDYGGGSGTPPQCSRSIRLIANRREKTLDYYATYSDVDWYTVIRFQFDVVAGMWTVYFDQIHSPCIFTSFTEFLVPEHSVPVRYAEFYHYFPTPTGLYVHLKWLY